MTWMTPNQFFNKFKPCCKCGAIANWIPDWETTVVYCDDCFPYKQEKEAEHGKKFEDICKDRECKAALHGDIRMCNCEDDYILMENDLLNVWDGEYPKLWTIVCRVKYCPICGEETIDYTDQSNKEYEV